MLAASCSPWWPCWVVTVEEGHVGGNAAGIATSRMRTVAGWEGVVVQKDLETP